ncbi:MAG: Tm-1-like ATP-binding domain-containing protein [bacterium]
MEEGARTIALIGALDTKGAEYAFVKERIEAQGLKTLLIDVGVLGQPAVKPDVLREEVVKAGGGDLVSLQSKKDRGDAAVVMSRGAAALLPKLHAEGRFDGVMALGGTDPMRLTPRFLAQVKDAGFAGAQNFPTVGLIDGFYGASSMERLPTERAIREQTEKFTRIRKGGAHRLGADPDAGAFNRSASTPSGRGAGR